MVELLGTLPLRDVGSWTIVAIVILLILSDKLITKQRLLDEREEKAYYRGMVDTLQASFDKMSDSIERQVVLAEATNHALVEIQQLAIRSQEAYRL